MFVIELTYKVDLAEIDARMAAHVIFLKKYYASGNFLVSGRKVPRDGGIILAVGRPRPRNGLWFRSSGRFRLSKPPRRSGWHAAAQWGRCCCGRKRNQLGRRK